MPGRGRAVSATMSEGPKLLMPVTLSLLGHVVIFALLLCVPYLSFHRELPPRIITVDLVTLPDRSKAVAVTEKSPLPPPKPKTKHVSPPPKPESKKVPPPQVKSKAVSLAPVKMLPVESLKKRTFRSSLVVESAIKRIEREVRKSRPDPVKMAIDQIRSEVKQQEAAGRSVAVSEAGEKRALKALDEYRVRIADHIERNWVFAEQMAAGKKNLSAWVVIEVAANGTIRNFWFEKRSGNAYLDESAARAIQKSNPLPPFPQGVTGSTTQLELHFAPSGLQ